MTSEVSRRDFLKASAAGAGFVLTFRIAGGATSAAEAAGARVRHLPSGKFLTYGDIVSKGLITATLSDEELKKIQLKKPAEYKVIGKWIQRLDVPEKTNGRAKFGIDRFLPGMVYAKVIYPPTRTGSKVVSVDDSEARKVKGYIRKVITEDLVTAYSDRQENSVKT